MVLFAVLLLAAGAFRFGRDLANRRRSKDENCFGGSAGRRKADPPAAARPVPKAAAETRPAGQSQQRFKDAAQSLEDAVRRGQAIAQGQLLTFYGLYKQATEGDVRGPQPWATNLKARAKYDSWASRRGLSREEAMEQYIREVAKL